MGDVLLVACGGGATSTVSNAEDLQSTPIVILTNNSETATIAYDDLDSIKKSMKNYRVVIPFMILGGELSTSIVRDVISCARECECKVVSVLGMPLEIEQVRRQRAVKNLSDVVALSDCSLVFDMQKSMDIFSEQYVDRKFDFFLKMIDRVVMKSIESIIECLNGPFFTIFKEKLYAFASFNDVLPLNAVRKAWDQMMFDNDTLKESCVVMVSSRISTAEMEEIGNVIVMEKGIMPEVVRRSDTEDSKVIVFKAVRSF